MAIYLTARWKSVTTSGDWATNSNWIGGVPRSPYAAELPTGNYVVTSSAYQPPIDKLSIGANVDLKIIAGQIHVALEGNNSGKIELSGGDLLFGPSPFHFRNDGEIDLSGGHLQIYGTFQDWGTISVPIVDGIEDNKIDVYSSSLTIESSGNLTTFNIPLTIDAPRSGAKLVNDGLINAGGIIFGGPASRIGDASFDSNYLVLVNKGIIEARTDLIIDTGSNNIINEAGATLEGVGATLHIGDGTSANANATLINAGLIEAGEWHGAVEISTKIRNEGTIIAKTGFLDAPAIVHAHEHVTNSGAIDVDFGGQVQIDNGLTGTGSVTINGGLLIFGGVTESSSVAHLFDENVTFVTGQHGVLQLQGKGSAIPHFTGNVIGFAAGDGLEFQAVNFGADTKVWYRPNAENSGGLLVVTDGTTTESMHLVGVYDPHQFHTSSSQTASYHDGTLVTYGTSGFI